MGESRRANGQSGHLVARNGNKKDGGGSPKTGKLIYASICGKDSPMPPVLANAATTISRVMGMPVVAFIQNGTRPWGEVNDNVWLKFLEHRDELVPDEPVAILLHSPGGYADAAYRLAQLFRRHCGGYTVIVPAYAKSAATLFALGADEIVLGKYGELGPLDAQLDDLDREQRLSALEVTQSLERLNAEALEAVDAHMMWWSHRSGKKIDTLLPIATKFVAELMRPLFEKVDTVHYTKMARVLKVAQDYAARLLRNQYGQNDADNIAAMLTELYPEHGFVIDRDELDRIGLKYSPAATEMEDSIGPLVATLAGGQHGSYLGLVKETDHDKKEDNEAKNGDGCDTPPGQRRGKQNSRPREAGAADALG